MLLFGSIIAFNWSTVAICIVAILQITVSGSASVSTSSTSRFEPILNSFDDEDGEINGVHFESPTLGGKECYQITVQVCIPGAYDVGSINYTLPQIPDFNTTTTTSTTTTTLPTTETTTTTTTEQPDITTTTELISTTTTEQTINSSTTTTEPVPTTETTTTTGTTTTEQPDITTTTELISTTTTEQTINSSSTTTTKPVLPPSCKNDLFDCPTTNHICTPDFKCVNTNTAYVTAITRCSSDCPSECPTGACRQCKPTKICSPTTVACTNNLYDCPKRNYYCNSELKCVSNTTGASEPASLCSSNCPESCGEGEGGCTLCAPSKICAIK